MLYIKWVRARWADFEEKETPMFNRDKGFRRSASVLFLACGALMAAAFQQAGTGLVGYWKFDETSGTVAADSSGNGNDLAYLPGPAYPLPSTSVPVPPVTFTDRESLSFDGSSTYVSISTLSGFPTGNTPHTTAGWVKVNALPPAGGRAWMLLLGNNGAGAEHWLLNSNGNTQLGVYGGVQFAPPLAVGTWHHIALTFDGTNLVGYMDGLSLGSMAATYNFAGVSLEVAQAQNGEDYFNGQIDDLRIYNRALGSAEVSALAGGAGGPSAVGLTATAGNSQVVLNWTTSGGPGSVTYTVGVSPVSGGSPPGTYTTLASGLTTTTYTDSTALNGGTYYYVVYAVSFGTTASNEATATPGMAAPVSQSRGKGETNCQASASPSPGLTPLLVGLAVLGLLVLRRR
jgi:MYXO-CTERM domain-containing protein